MPVIIAMPRMSTDPVLTTAQSKYVESLARAGAQVRWVELADPDKAAANSLSAPTDCIADSDIQSFVQLRQTLEQIAQTIQSTLNALQ